MSKYISPGSGKIVEFRKYLAECLVLRKAQKEGVKLPAQYWKNPNYILWNKELKHQIYGVTSLLKVYSQEAILNVFLQNDWIYSIYLPKFKNLIQEEQRKINNRQIEDIPIISTIYSKPISKFGTQSKISKLRD